MLSKEELMSGLQDLILDRESFINEDDKYSVFIKDKFILESAINYINQLETREQKLIEKLEEKKFKIKSTYSQINGNYFMAQDRLDLINEILEILKGENDE